MQEHSHYTPPALTVLGTLADLTWGTGAALADGCDFNNIQSSDFVDPCPSPPKP
jgi:hypothetical protein